MDALVRGAEWAEAGRIPELVADADNSEANVKPPFAAAL
jgi:hypothetical protein